MISRGPIALLVVAALVGAACSASDPGADGADDPGPSIAADSTVTGPDASTPVSDDGVPTRSPSTTSPSITSTTTTTTTTTTLPEPVEPLFEFVDVAAFRPAEPYIRSVDIAEGESNAWVLVAELADPASRTSTAQVASIVSSDAGPVFSGFSDLPLGDADVADVVDVVRIDGSVVAVGNVGAGPDELAAAWYLDGDQWTLESTVDLTISGTGDGRFVQGHRTTDDGPQSGIIEIGPDGPVWLVEYSTNVQLFDDDGTAVIVDRIGESSHELSFFDGTSLVALEGPPETQVFARAGDELEVRIAARTGSAFWRVFRSADPAGDEWREIPFPAPDGEVVQNPYDFEGVSAWTGDSDQSLRLTDDGTLVPIIPRLGVDGDEVFAVETALSEDGTSAIFETGLGIAVFDGAWTFVDGVPDLQSTGVDVTGAWNTGSALIVSLGADRVVSSASSADGIVFEPAAPVPSVETDCGRDVDPVLFDGRVIDAAQTCLGLVEFADPAIPSLEVDPEGGIVVQPVVGAAAGAPVVVSADRSNQTLSASSFVDGAWNTSELGPNVYDKPCVGRAGDSDFAIAGPSTGYVREGVAWQAFDIPSASDFSECFVHDDVTAFASSVSNDGDRVETLVWSRDRVDWVESDFGGADVSGIVTVDGRLLAFGSSDRRPAIWVESDGEWSPIAEAVTGAPADDFDHLSIVGDRVVGIDFTGPAATVMTADLQTFLDAIEDL